MKSKFDNFIFDQEVDGIHFSVIACLKEIPQFLYIPANWIDPTLLEVLPEGLPKDLNGKWIVIYLTVDFGSYWHEQEQEFNTMMRFIDYCDSNENVLFYKVTNEVEPFMVKKRREKMKDNVVNDGYWINDSHYNESKNDGYVPNNNCDDTHYPIYCSCVSNKKAYRFKKFEEAKALLDKSEDQVYFDLDKFINCCCKMATIYQNMDKYHLYDDGNEYWKYISNITFTPFELIDVHHELSEKAVKVPFELSTNNYYVILNHLSVVDNFDSDERNVKFKILLNRLNELEKEEKELEIKNLSEENNSLKEKKEWPFRYKFTQIFEFLYHRKFDRAKDFVVGYGLLLANYLKLYKNYKFVEKVALGRKGWEEYYSGDMKKYILKQDEKLKRPSFKLSSLERNLLADKLFNVNVTKEQKFVVREKLKELKREFWRRCFPIKNNKDFWDKRNNEIVEKHKEEESFMAGSMKHSG